MLKSKILKQMFKTATLAMMFGVASVHAQSEKGDTAASAKPTASAKGDAVSRKDQKMMRDMARANIAEIEAGQLALTNSQDEQVKAFAQKMVDDHTKAQKELQQLAESKGVKLPTKPDAKHQALVKTLGGLSGEQFDRLYMAQGGLADHKKAHRMLQRAQSGATDQDVKALAEKTQPVVEEHLNMAQQLRVATADGKKTAASPADRAKMAPAATSGGSTSGGAASGDSAK